MQNNLPVVIERNCTKNEIGYSFFLSVYSIVVTTLVVIYFIGKKKSHEKHFYDYQDKVISEQMNEMK